jgi:outer membrane protein OmpA-like peptidoglycan-associated protein
MMMRNRFTVLKAAVIVLTLYAATMLSACSTPGREGPDVMVVIVEQHANSASGVPEDVIRYAVEAEVPKFSIIRLDGAPEVVVTANLTSKAKNKAARQVEIDRLVGELTTLAGAVVAEQPEVNLLAGLSLAARILGTDGRRELVVAASGLNTAGPLKLQEPGMLEAEPGDIIAALGDEVPSLDGVDLLFNGLGDTGGPDQERPSGTSRMHLVSLWEAIGGATGARVRVDSSPRTGEAPSGLPPVTVIEFAEVVIELPAQEEPPTAIPLPAGTHFVPNSADLLDRQATMQAISQVAAAGKDGHTITLIGTTARAGTPEGEIRLSGLRAEAIRDLLIEAGVDPALVEVQACGSGRGEDLPGSCIGYYTPDKLPGGGLDPVAAAKNRAVWFLASR